MAGVLLLKPGFWVPTHARAVRVCDWTAGCSPNRRPTSWAVVVVLLATWVPTFHVFLALIVADALALKGMLCEVILI